MEGRHKTVEQFCLGCLNSAPEYKVQDYRIQYAHFWAIFESSAIRLCYLCKRIAQHAELFIQNVQSNQKLLQNYLGDITTTIEEARSQLQSSINLSESAIDVTSYIKNDSLSSTIESKITELIMGTNNKKPCEDNSLCEVIAQNEKVEINKEPIKMEFKVEESIDISDGGSDDQNNDFQECVLKEDDDFPLNVLKKGMQIENIQAKSLNHKKRDEIKIPKEKKMVRNIKELENYAEIGIKRITLSPEECMEDRKQQAKDQVYLNCAYKCEDCLKGFNFKAAFDNHRIKHSEAMGKYKCDICNLRMDMHFKLQNHMKCHTVRFQCTLCGITRTSRSTLYDHYNAVHRQGEGHFSCPHCPKTFKRQLCHWKHIRYTHQNTERVICAYCDKSYANKGVLKSHMMAKHPKEVSALAPNKRYGCGECGLMFRSPSDLRMHGYKHTHTRDYYCVECDKAFKSEAVLKQHLKNAQPHINYSNLPLICEHCDKRFAIKRDLERHMNSVHLEVKPFKCDKCDKAYFSKCSLRDHTRLVHEGYKRPLRHPCKLCDKIFDSGSTLKAHIRTHTGERPYQCDKCPAQFTQSGALATHNKLIHQRLTRDGKPKQNLGQKTIKILKKCHKP